ncbi:MAG: hypothetical protein MUC43_00130 [Pirellula sp.]|jgi:hypothetical protein|nr:hypothetical protein [Pirellula sp.]
MITQADSFVADVASDFAEESIVADGLLSEIVEQGRAPTYAEKVYFAKHLRWDEREVGRQLTRMAAVIRDLRIAGSKADRDAATKEAQASAKILDTQGPKIAEQIEKLQAQLRSLERDAQLSTKRVEEQAEAVVRLRENAPVHIADKVRIERERITEGVWREIENTKSRISEIESVLDPSKHEGGEHGYLYLDAVARVNHEAVVWIDSKPYRKRALSPAWPSIKRGLEKELSELRAKLKKLTPQYEAEVVKIEADLNFYVTRRG